MMVITASVDGVPEAPPLRLTATEKNNVHLEEEVCGVTGGCATFDACDGDGNDECKVPDAYVCENQLPGLSTYESSPSSTMLPCWMSSVDGNLRLSKISIPGTHDTMAKGFSACLQDGQANYVHTQVRWGTSS